MATTAESPVNISLGAADRIFELGAWPEFKAMLQHTRRALPGLRSISVSLDDLDDRRDPIVLIGANVDENRPDDPGMADESPEWEWDRWAAETFPPDVLRHFCMMGIPVADDEDDGR